MKFVEAKGAVLSDYRGLNVQQMAELRSRLREAAVELQVVKNTLARRAAGETAFVQLADYFVGPTSIAFTTNDVVAMAKALTEYAKTEPKLAIRAGLVEGKVISPQEVAALAELPPREVLLARLFGKYAESSGRFRWRAARGVAAVIVCLTCYPRCQRRSIWVVGLGWFSCCSIAGENYDYHKR